MYKEQDKVLETKLSAEMRGERMHPSGLYESQMHNTRPNRKAQRASKR